jgi:hypothetical protein
VSDVSIAIRELKREGLWGALSLDVANFLGTEIARMGNYVEWGAGVSTRLVSRLDFNWARCIETDKAWIETLQEDQRVNDATSIGRLEFTHVNLGPTKQWGYPVNTISKFVSRSYHLAQVVDASIKLNGEPSVIFIDGRFRVACALACFGLMPAGSMLLVDDYDKRDSYHVLEQVCKLESMIGRAGLFIIDQDLTPWATMFATFETVQL